MRSAVRVADRNPDKNQTDTPNKFRNANASRQKNRTEKPGKYCATRERDDSGRKAGEVENAQKVIGKDEVASSNLASSSRKHLKSSDFGCFLFCLENFFPMFYPGKRPRY